MKAKLISVTGLISPCEWDNNGEPIELKLSSAGEVEFIIKNDKYSKSLMKHLRNWVAVTGEISILDRIKYIKINKFIPIKKNIF